MNLHELLDLGPADLAALYAAGALSADERARVELLLADDGGVLEAEVRDLDPVVLALAEAAPPVEPDPRTRARLLATIGGSHAAVRPTELYVQRAAEGVWLESKYPGISVRVLYHDQATRRVTAMVRLAPGAAYPEHPHTGSEECLVLEGELRVGEHLLRVGDYQRAEPGYEHAVQSSEGGALLLLTAPAEAFAR